MASLPRLRRIRDSIRWRSRHLISHLHKARRYGLRYSSEIALARLRGSLQSIVRKSTHDDGPLSAAQQRRALDSLKWKASLAILVSLDRDSTEAFRETLSSLIGQLVHDWRLVILAEPEIGTALRSEIADLGHRCHLLGDRDNDPRTLLTDTLAKIGADYVLILEPGVVLRSDALTQLAVEISGVRPDLLYCDELISLPHCRILDSKPDWSPVSFEAQPYFGAAVVVQGNRLLHAAQSGDWNGPKDEITELLRKSARVDHFRQPLFDVPSNATHHLARTRCRTTRESDTTPPMVSIIIPTRDRADLLEACLRSIFEKTPSTPFEVVIVDNESREPATRELLRRSKELHRDTVRVLEIDGPFDFAAINNRAASEARGDVLLFLNNDIEITSEGWLEGLVDLALRNEVGAVGALLLYPNGSIQHAGIALGPGGVAANLHAGAATDVLGPRGPREVSAVTGACLMIRREVFEAIGGFDPELAVTFNDVDLCLRVRDAGLRVVVEERVELIHHESMTRGASAHTPERERFAREVALMKTRWGADLSRDPHWPGSIESRTRVRVFCDGLRIGYGVDLVVARQLEYLIARGYPVDIHLLEIDRAHERRFRDAIAKGRLRIHRVAMRVGQVENEPEDCSSIQIFHTPTFLPRLSALSRRSLCVAIDYGEPPPGLFPDRATRIEVLRNKHLALAEASRVLGISKSVREESNLESCEIVRLGIDHLLVGRRNLAELVGRFRRAHGLTDEFLVLTTSRYLTPERLYKGVDRIVEIRSRLLARHPELERQVVFALVGHARERDRKEMQRAGLLALRDLDDDELVAAYLDADHYLAPSRWEGFDLGLGQALAFGLPASASDVAAHREFEVRVSDDSDQHVDWITAAVRESAKRAGRPTLSRKLANARCEPWKRSLVHFETHLVHALADRLPTTQPNELPALTRHRAELAGLDRKIRATRDCIEATTRPRISFLILTRDQHSLLRACIDSIERTCSVPHEILIGDTGSRSRECLDYFETTDHPVHFLGHYHFSTGINVLAARAGGEYLVLLNDDVEQLTFDADAALACFGADPRVDCLGATLLYPDRRIQHAGIRFCTQGPHRLLPEHIDRFANFDDERLVPGTREVHAVTGACAMLRADRFRELGGLDEAFEEEAQDIDLCLRLRDRGGLSLISDSWVAYHVEGATRTRKESREDRALFLDRYRDKIEKEWLPEQEALGESRPYQPPAGTL